MASAILLSEEKSHSCQFQPYHEVEVNVVHVKRLERRSNALFHTLVPWVVQLGRHPDIFTWDARVLDTLSNLVLVAVREGGVDVAVACEECGLDSIADLVWLGLPGAETDGWDLCTLFNVSIATLSFMGRGD